MRGRAWIKIVLILTGAVAAAGIFVLGRATADPPTRGYAAGQRAGHDAGVREGRAAGRREGRALQQAKSSPAQSRNAVRIAFDNGYAAGANDVFAGYDGGWDLTAPYLVGLGRGSGSVTYRIDSRTPVHEGVNYYLCPRSRAVCQEPRR